MRAAAGLSFVAAAALALPAQAADCAALYQAHLASDLKLDYQAFDQSEGSGFRVLAAAGCHKESADLIERYVEATGARQPSLVWHVAQARASAGDYPAAIASAERSLDPKEDLAKFPFRWNDYVQATLGFLRRDKAALVKYRDRVAAGAEAHFGNRMNLKLLDALVEHFDLGYAEATSRIKN